MRRNSAAIAAAAALALGLACTLVAAVRGKQCLYLAGTVPGLAENTAGELDLSDPSRMIFIAGNEPRFSIPWDHIDSLEYGQKAGRRLGVALVVTPWILMSKKRRHFLTLGYTDLNGKPQGVLLEIGKNEVAGAIVVIEARSGRKVQYESLDAEAHVHG